MLVRTFVERRFEPGEAEALLLQPVVVRVVAGHGRRIRDPGMRGPSLKGRPS